MKINKLERQLQWGGGIGIGVLAVLTVGMLCPANPSVQAEGESDSALAMVREAVQVKPMIALSLDSLVNTEVVPTSVGGVNAAVADLTVTTNSSNGFAVFMNGANGTDLKSSDKNNTAVISSTTKSATLTGLDANTWGFYIGGSDPGDNDQFGPIPGDSTKIAEKTMNGGVTNYKLAFGTKVDPKIPAGTYTGGVVVSAVANPITVTNLMQLTYMQEMTSDICENTLSAVDDPSFKMQPITKRLIDTRDGKSYWVAKLADGKCWMTQNLAFDVKVKDDGTSNVLAADTDVMTDWTVTPPVGWHGWKEEWNALALAMIGTANGSSERQALTEAFGDSGWKIVAYFSADKSNQYNTFTYTYEESGESKTVTYNPPMMTDNELPIRDKTNVPGWATRSSFDFGQVMSGILPTNEDYGCNNGLIGPCKEKGIIDVGDERQWSPTFTAQMGSFELGDGTTFEGTILANQANQTYDAHYLFGNYYQDPTIRARSGYSTGVDSLCPKNWRLPVAEEGNDDFVNLLTQYGSATSTTDQYHANMKVAPLYFPLTGFTWASRIEDGGGIFYLNRSGWYASSTVSDSSVRSLMVKARDNIATIVRYNKDAEPSYLRTVRCLAK